MARRRGVAEAVGELDDVVLAFLCGDGTYTPFDQDGPFADRESARRGWQRVRGTVWSSAYREEVWPPAAAVEFDGLKSRVEARGTGIGSVAELRDLVIDDLADVARFRRERASDAADAGAGLDEYDEALRRLLEVLETDGRTPTFEAWSALFGRRRRGA